MIDINKTYRYRNGEPARILCTDRSNGKEYLCPVVSMRSDGSIWYHHENGNICQSIFDERDQDLIEVKEKKVLWVNVYRYDGDYYGNAWSTKQDCKDEDQRLKDREGTLVSRVRMEFEEEQFDE